jgi:DNA primase
MGVKIETLEDLKSERYIDKTAKFAAQYGMNFRRNGTSYIAECPFHSDSTPSLNLHCSRSGVRFHCFSDKCDVKSWDVFELIQRQEDVGFIDAVKMFASYVGEDEFQLPDGSRFKVG